jgi:hypothetical protein
MSDHSVASVLDVHWPERERLTRSQPRAEQHLERVPDVAVGLGSLDTGTGPPASGSVSDPPDLIERE